MKKLVLVLALVFAGIMSANAQQLWIGGSANAAVQQNLTEFTIAPEIGYNFNSQWAIATGLGYTYHNENTAGLGNFQFNRFIVSPYVRYIGGTIGKKFSLFCDLTYDIDILSPQMWRAGLQPGIAWMATEKFTAAFRFAFLGYDHFFSQGQGFFMNFALATPAGSTPAISIYYNF